MIFEKLIEIAKYYDWESIFRGSLNSSLYNTDCRVDDGILTVTGAARSGVILKLEREMMTADK